MDRTLSGKVAVVTGAGHPDGLGAAIVEALLERGAKAVVAADLAVTASDAERYIGGIAARGLNGGEFMPLDITALSDHAGFVSAIAAKHGGIDILVNNAGVGPNTSVATLDEAKFDLVFGVNVKGTVFLSQAVARQMIAQRRGSIVSIASAVGLVGIKNHLAYSMAKHAIAGMTKCLALELVGDGIRVNAIAPARIRTRWVIARAQEAALASEGAKTVDDVLREMSATQASGKMLEPAEVAAFVAYLASDDARGFNGAVLSMDDCWTAA